MRRLRSRVALTVIGAFLGVLTLVGTSPTLAAWQDREHATATITSGFLAPPTNLRCTGGGLLAPITFVWDPPVGGVARDIYSWTSSAPLLGNASTGTFGAATTSFTISPSLLSVGTVQFRLRAVTGPWVSSEAVSQFGVTLGLIANC